MGAKDKREVCFTLKAEEVGLEKFNTVLINFFGARNLVGGMKFSVAQRLSQHTKLVKRIEVPAWADNVPEIPGVGLSSNTEFKLSPMTPARVCSGDLNEAKGLLRTLLKIHPYAPILVATILGAPAVARWRPDDRIALALWAVTGTQKTTAAKAAMTVYGSDYLSDRYLLKHGKSGSTSVAALEIMAAAGFLPQILDNVKNVDSKDTQEYTKIIHAVIEGSDKQRGKKDGGLREAKEFRCTPIITGEVRPEEASTDARVLNLSWSQPNLNILNEIEVNAAKMPTIGYHWLRYLAETKLSLNEEFTEYRSRKELEFSRAGHVNAGRLATIYTVLKSIWRLLLESPFGDVFNEYTEDFKKALDTAIAEQGSIVSQDTEAAKFIVGVNELLASQPGLFQSKDGSTMLGRVVGKHTDEGLFLLPNEVLAELGKLKVFTQTPTVDSMGKALSDAGKLITDKDGKHRQIKRRVSGKLVRGWLLNPQAFDNVPSGVGTEKQQREPPVPTVPAVPSINEREGEREEIEKSGEKNNNYPDSNENMRGSEEERKKVNKESGGNSGYNGYSNDIDSDFDVPTPSPSKEEAGTPPNLDGIKDQLKRAEDTPKSKFL